MRVTCLPNAWRISSNEYMFTCTSQNTVNRQDRTGPIFYGKQRTPQVCVCFDWKLCISLFGELPVSVMSGVLGNCIIM
jgi:hypothetical protein